MLSIRLIRAIEDHAEELTQGVLADLGRNPRTAAYHSLPQSELHRRVYDVYRNLGRWLGDSDQVDDPVEAAYNTLGRTRKAEGIALSEVVYALLLTKHHLRAYIRSSGLVGSAVELYQEEELHRLIGRFFDKAVYFTVRGYEGSQAA